MDAIISPLVDAAPRPGRGAPARGLVVAAVVVGLGACLVRPSPHGVPWADCGVLAAMAASAILGANEARRMTDARREDRDGARAISGGWMTVVIGSQGPADTAGVRIHPKAPPRDDPERRSLSRRAGERRQAAGARR